MLWYKYLYGAGRLHAQETNKTIILWLNQYFGSRDPNTVLFERHQLSHLKKMPNRINVHSVHTYYVRSYLLIFRKFWNFSGLETSIRLRPPSQVILLANLQQGKESKLLCAWLPLGSVSEPRWVPEGTCSTVEKAASRSRTAEST